MTRHKALTRAADLLRLHMSTPPVDVLAELDAMAHDVARDPRERVREFLRESRIKRAEKMRAEGRHDEARQIERRYGLSEVRR